MTDVTEQQKTPIFSIIAVVCSGFALMSPLLLITMPLLAAAVCGIIGLVRKERPRWLALAALGLSALLLVVSAKQMSNIRSGLGGSASTADLSAVEVTDWSWDADPSFGTQGTVKWRFTVRNKTDKPIESVRVEFTTYDASKKMLTTTPGWVRAIPAGGERSDESYADYYGTEQEANLVVTDVRYAN